MVAEVSGGLARVVGLRVHSAPRNLCTQCLSDDCASITCCWALADLVYEQLEQRLAGASWKA